MRRLRLSVRSSSRWCTGRPRRSITFAGAWRSSCGPHSPTRSSAPRPGPASRCQARCGHGCSAPGWNARRRRGPIRRGGTTLAAQGCRRVEPYVTRYLPALVTRRVVPALAVGALFVVDWPSAVIVVLTLPLLPLFAALIGADHPGGHRPSLGRAPRAVRPLPRRRARPSDAGRLRTGYAPGRDRAVGQRAPPRGDDGHPAAVVPVLRGARAAGHALAWPSSPSRSACGSRRGTSTSCPGWSRSCWPPRRTGRSAGWAPSSTPPPTVRRPWTGSWTSSTRTHRCRRAYRAPASSCSRSATATPATTPRFCATSRSRPAAGSPW